MHDRRESSNSGFSREGVVDETVANLRARLSLSVVIVVASVVIGAAVPWATAIETTAIATYNDRMVASGANVFSVKGVSNNPISGIRCEQLNDVDGVLAAGGRISTDALAFPQAPSIVASKVVGTAHFGEIIWPEPRNSISGPGVIAGSEIASTLGLVPGAFVSEVGEQLQVDQIAQGSPRDSSFNRTVLVVASPDSRIQQCLVESEPGASAGVGLLLTSWFVDERVLVSPFVINESLDISPNERLERRISSLFPLIGGLSVAALLMGFWMLRRSDFAVYRLLGMTRFQVFCTMTMESFLLAIVPTSVGLSFAILANAPVLSGFVLTSVAIDSLRYAVLLFLLPAAGFLAVGTRNAFRTVLEGS